MPPSPGMWAAGASRALSGDGAWGSPRQWRERGWGTGVTRLPPPGWGRKPADADASAPYCVCVLTTAAHAENLALASDTLR